jgi:hypothetical protein
MLKLSAIQRKDVLEEMRHLAGDYLTNQGPLSGLRKELSNQDYVDPMYLREKIQTVRSTMDALEHDLKILERANKD